MTNNKQTNCECGTLLTEDFGLQWNMCETCYDYVADHEDYNNSRLGSSLDNQPMDFDGRFQNG